MVKGRALQVVLLPMTCGAHLKFDPTRGQPSEFTQFE